MGGAEVGGAGGRGQQAVAAVDGRRRGAAGSDGQPLKLFGAELWAPGGGGPSGRPWLFATAPYRRSVLRYEKFRPGVATPS